MQIPPINGGTRRQSPGQREPQRQTIKASCHRTAKAFAKISRRCHQSQLLPGPFWDSSRVWAMTSRLMSGGVHMRTGDNTSSRFIGYFPSFIMLVCPGLRFLRSGTRSWWQDIISIMCFRIDVDDDRDEFEFLSSLRGKQVPIAHSKMSLVANAVSMFNSFTDTFYHSFGNGSAVWAVNMALDLPNRRAFWTQVETIEVAEQYYELYGTDPQDYIVPLLDGLSNSAISGTPNFASWNEYNDDVMWAVIALLRGYAITGENEYLEHAKSQFDVVWDRAYDDELGGGLWWTVNKTSKNACINSPTAIAAQLLANSGAGDQYHNKSVAIFNWMKNTLYNNTTGEIYDNIQAGGTVEPFSLSYNQGTFIGAATLLAIRDSTSSYLDDAALALDFTRKSLTHPGTEIVWNEADDPNSGDAPGFKGILFRWSALYTHVAGDVTARDFLIANAKQVWDNRNSIGLSWTHFLEQTPDTGLASWGCSSALSAAVAGSAVA